MEATLATLISGGTVGAWGANSHGEVGSGAPSATSVRALHPVHRWPRPFLSVRVYSCAYARLRERNGVLGRRSPSLGPGRARTFGVLRAAGSAMTGLANTVRQLRPRPDPQLRAGVRLPQRSVLGQQRGRRTGSGVTSSDTPTPGSRRASLSDTETGLAKRRFPGAAWGPMVKAVLFDFYNTLAETTRWGPSWEELVAELGYELPAEVRDRWWNDGHRRHRARRALALPRPLRRLAAGPRAHDARRVRRAGSGQDVFIERVREIGAHNRIDAYDEVARRPRELRGRGDRARDLFELGLGSARGDRSRPGSPARSTSSCRRPGSARASRTRGSTRTRWSSSASRPRTRCSSATPGPATSTARAPAGMRAIYLRRTHLGADQHCARIRTAARRCAPRRGSAQSSRSELRFAIGSARRAARPRRRYRRASRGKAAAAPPSIASAPRPPSSSVGSAIATSICPSTRRNGNAAATARLPPREQRQRRACRTRPGWGRRPACAAAPRAARRDRDR